MALGTKSTIQSPATAVETKNINNILHFMAEITDIRECNNPELLEEVDGISFYKSSSGSLYLWAECTHPKKILFYGKSHLQVLHPKYH